MVQRRVLRGHKNWVYAVEWSPDGRLLASCSTDHTLRVWRSFDAGDANAEDVDETDARAADGEGDGEGAGAWMTPGGTEGGGGGRRVIEGGPTVRNTTVGRLQQAGDAWRWRECKVLRGHTKPVSDFSWSACSTMLLTISTDGTIRVWDCRHLDPAQWAESHCITEHKSPSPADLRACCWWPGAGVSASSSAARRWRFVTAAEDGGLKWWLSASARVPTSHPSSPSSPSPASLAPFPQSWSCTQLLAGHTAAVNDIAFSADGMIMISGADDATLRVWHLGGDAEWVRVGTFRSRCCTPRQAIPRPCVLPAHRANLNPY